MEAAYSDTVVDSVTLLGSWFYGCTFQPKHSVIEFMSEIDHIVSRSRATDAIVLHDDHIIAKVMMLLPLNLKLIFKVGWESTAPEQKTLRNLTTRLVEMEKEVKKSEKAAEALVSKRELTLAYKKPTSDDSRGDQKTYQCNMYQCNFQPKWRILVGIDLVLNSIFKLLLNLYY